LILVLLSKTDNSHAPEMYISINSLITHQNTECSQDEPSNCTCIKLTPLTDPNIDHKL